MFCSRLNFIVLHLFKIEYKRRQGKNYWMWYNSYRLSNLYEFSLSPYFLSGDISAYGLYSTDEITKLKNVCKIMHGLIALQKDHSEITQKTKNSYLKPCSHNMILGV